MISAEPTPPRRRFLRLLALSAAAAGTLGGARDVEARSTKSIAGVLVFRLQTRKHHSCNACKSHHKAMVFRTHALGDQNRAHPGCNCPIIRQKLTKKDWKKLFAKGGLAASGVADLRKVSLPGSPK